MELGLIISILIKIKWSETRVSYHQNKYEFIAFTDYIRNI